jgi:hypothetical protein
MKRILIAASLACLIAGPALAQQQPPDPVMLQHALTAVRAQREQAFDQSANWEATARRLSDDLAKANARIKELEPKPEAPKE